ncbi:MAG: tripartite tricarboxylate transporter permease [Candidatus Rokubacteria bacterium]|nr:tripartite tricarboxylate transporter permease [Candidatus Rokubacteria bacterium]MBI3109099.1 tripartite tricarboxylate transporter permease [Candidatus Rokubacteria bacterium]
MNFLPDVLHGFSVALAPVNLLYCFLGVLMGTLVGVLPGLGAPAAIALLLPATLSLDPVGAVIMLSGIFYGAMYGGSTTSILVNIPGEAASVVTCIDGYRLARQGRAGAALGICAIASFTAGTLGVIGLMLLAGPLTAVALSFGPPEYLLIFVGGLGLAVSLAQGSAVKGLVMVIAGLIAGTVGIDTVSGEERFTLGSSYLQGGIDFIVVAMGLFGIAEILANIKDPPERAVFSSRLSQLFPTREDWRAARTPIARGSVVGFFLGLLPGGGAILASFISYAVEKRLSKTPQRFGRGAIEGVAGPEAANNSAAAAAFVPLLTLGIPFNVVTALILAALMMHGVRPGPLLVQKHPDLFWGVITSMYVGNAMLLALNLPLVGLFAQLLRVPYRILFPTILVVTFAGAYSLNNNVWDMVAMTTFGIIGYVLRRGGFEPAPFVLALVLGAMMELSFRQSLILSRGTLEIFVTRPASLVLLAVIVTAAAASIALKLGTRSSQPSGEAAL